ncbi:MAG: hypothetical protein WC824_14695 [Bacteroidota bacterium]|jgi:hypothetical protein
MNEETKRKILIFPDGWIAHLCKDGHYHAYPVRIAEKGKDLIVWLLDEKTGGKIGSTLLDEGEAAILNEKEARAEIARLEGERNVSRKT